MRTKRWLRRLTAIAIGLALGWLAAGFFEHVRAAW